jgi:threonine aldolase
VPIDLRSDTVTRPTAAMRDAISRAEVGDDVFGEDPTVQALEAEAARLTGKEAALFVTSGTMSNQLAIALQTRPGDEVIVGEGAHVYVFESGAGAALSGVQFAIAGSGGLFDGAAMEERINPRAHWSARTSLVCVENTHNRAGGRIFPQPDAVAIAEAARSRGFAVHLDGARIWNASAATGLPVAELCAPFDTISVCFSKGLGAPAGSALCASKKLIDEARFFRKRWGGGMRQSGILAAGALFALEHHRERLREDHYKAKKLAERLSMAPGASVDVAKVETNIVNIDLEKAGDLVAKKAAEAGVLINASGPKRLRAVLHLDVTPEDAERAGELLAGAIANA